MAKDRETLERDIRRLAPFHHDVELPHGLRTCPPDLARRTRDQVRLRDLSEHAFPSLLEVCGGSLKGLRVLDVACSCGGFSVEAHNRGADYVLGIDIVDRYIEQAQFIKGALELDNVEFRQLDVDEVEESTVGLFDVVFCFGILYHLQNPVGAMTRLSRVTRKIMLVDTALARTWFDRRPLWLMNVSTPAASLSAQSASTSLWRHGESIQFRPTASAVTELLRFLGFDQVRQLKPQVSWLEKRYYSGRWGTFLAVRGE